MPGFKAIQPAAIQGQACCVYCEQDQDYNNWCVAFKGDEPCFFPGGVWAVKKGYMTISCLCYILTHVLSLLQGNICPIQIYHRRVPTSTPINSPP